MSKKKYLKISPLDLFESSPDQTFIRPNKITISLENRGKDFQMEYEEIFQGKLSKETREFTFSVTLDALARIQEDLTRLQKYFYYQAKTTKKGFQLMIVSDDAFAMVAGILAELLVFGIRSKEDNYNIIPYTEAILKWINKINIIDG